jgi:hypothetical protein
MNPRHCAIARILSGVGSDAFAQFDFGVVTVKSLLLRRKRRRLGDPVRTHAIVARPDRRGVVHLIKFFLAPGEALHPCGARLPHPDEARERIEGPVLGFGDAAGQHVGVFDALRAAPGRKTASSDARRRP